MSEAKVEKAILGKLAELGGERFQEDSITYEGTRLVVPARMTAARAVSVLQSHIEQQEEVTSFSRTFKFRPWDGALATNRAIRTLTGTTGIARATYSFFGKNPPQLITINTGLNETDQVPWGQIEVPLFEGYMFFGSVKDREYGQLFSLSVEAKRKYRASVEGLFKLVEEELHTNSIYRGKAFDGQESPEFIDMDTVKPEHVIYSGDVTAQLNANVWSMLDHSDAMRNENVPLKRSVLLHGPYGTGKTLAAFLTAQHAVRNGWTFIYCRPGRDSLANVMATARLYQPSVVFFEDVDTIAGNAENDSVTQLLDLFDGITAKGTEILVVLTTNHPERIHKGMVRPGRLDAVIEIGSLDTDGVQRMIEAFTSSDVRDKNIDYEAIGGEMNGFLPAFVKEAIDRAKRYAIARNEGELAYLTTDDFINSARGLTPQLRMMDDAVEGVAADSLGKALASTVTRVIEDTVIREGEEPVFDMKVTPAPNL